MLFFPTSKLIYYRYSICTSNSDGLRIYYILMPRTATGSNIIMNNYVYEARVFVCSLAHWASRLYDIGQVCWVRTPMDSDGLLRYYIQLRIGEIMRLERATRASCVFPLLLAYKGRQSDILAYCAW